jgi:GDP-4-dehydro-6-deoxy-D-mannose reductase
MRAFITGGSGFVGRHLEHHLHSCGDVVTSADRECDVTRMESVRPFLAESQPEVIYHLAALTHVGESWADPTEYTRVNVLGTKNLLDAARQVAPQATVVFISSADVYGIVNEQDLPVRETFRTAPTNPYASSKLEAEHFARDAVREFGQHVIVIRPFNHVGPGQSTRFAIPALASRLFEARDEGRHEIRVGDLSTRRDFSDVRDVVRAYRLLTMHGRSGEIYNVASGIDTALSDIANTLRAEIAPEVQLVVDPTLLRPVEVPVMRGSFEKLHDATGWEPVITLETSLRDVVSEFRSASAKH